MEAGNLYIEFKDLTDQENIDINKFIINKEFINTCNSLYGIFSIDVIVLLSKVQNINISFRDIFNIITKREAECSVYFIIENKRFLFFNGILVHKYRYVENNKLEARLTFFHKTYRLKTQNIPIYYTSENKSILAAIQDLLSITNTNKTYDRLISNFDPIKILTVEKYAGSGQSVYNMIESILTDIPARMFTTIIDNLVYLYIYDNGSFIDNKDRSNIRTQAIQSNQYLSFNDSINWENIYDKIELNSEGSFDNTQDATVDVSKKNLVQHKSIGISNLLQTNKLNLGEIIHVRNSIDSSKQDDLRSWGEAMIVDSIDNAITISVLVPSLLQNLENINQGIWQLGARIDILDESLKELLANDFNIYTTNSDNYFFVLKGIEYTENQNQMSCKLIITLNDILRFKK